MDPIETVEQRLRLAVEPFKKALESYPGAPDEVTWLSTPDYRITIGDLRGLVREVEAANG